MTDKTGPPFVGRSAKQNVGHFARQFAAAHFHQQVDAAVGLDIAAAKNHTAGNIARFVRQAQMLTSGIYRLEKRFAYGRAIPGGENDLFISCRAGFFSQACQKGDILFRRQRYDFLLRQFEALSHHFLLYGKDTFPRFHA